MARRPSGAGPLLVGVLAVALIVLVVGTQRLLPAGSGAADSSRSPMALDLPLPRGLVATQGDMALTTATHDDVIAKFAADISPFVRFLTVQGTAPQVSFLTATPVWVAVWKTSIPDLGPPRSVLTPNYGSVCWDFLTPDLKPAGQECDSYSRMDDLPELPAIK